MTSIYHALGLLEQKCNNFTSARSYFHEGIALGVRSHRTGSDSTLPFLMHSLGSFEMHSNRWQEAKVVFSTALGMFPNQPLLLLGLAAANMKLGNYQDARALFQQSVKVDPFHAQAWFVTTC